MLLLLLLVNKRLTRSNEGAKSEQAATGKSEQRDRIQVAREQTRTNEMRFVVVVSVAAAAVVVGELICIHRLHCCCCCCRIKSHSCKQRGLSTRVDAFAAAAAAIGLC